MEKVRHGTDMVQTPVLKARTHARTLNTDPSSFPASESSVKRVTTAVKGGGETKLEMET